jgi:hypothetical protein
VISAEFSEACGVHQKLHIRLFPGQKFCKSRKAFFPAKIQADGPHGDLGFFPQRCQGLLPPGDGPDLVYLHIVGQLCYKFPAHAGRCAGYNGNFHKWFSSML